MDDKYKKYGIIFFEGYAEMADSDYEYGMEASALAYVKGNNDFKYQDHVDAGCLIRELEKLKYVRFVQKDSSGRKHIITDKGKEYLKELS